MERENVNFFFFLPISAVHKFSYFKMKLWLFLFSCVGPKKQVTFFAYGKRDKEVCWLYLLNVNFVLKEKVIDVKFFRKL